MANSITIWYHRFCINPELLYHVDMSKVTVEKGDFVAITCSKDHVEATQKSIGEYSEGMLEVC